MRVFLACVVDRDAADRLYAELEPMRREFDVAAFNWIRPANYHVTLRFFGELTAADITLAARRIEPVAAAASGFTGRTRSVLPLPNARRPNVIALPIESSDRLEALAEGLRIALDDEFGPPDKPFKAHLTVIRCGRGARFVASAVDLAFPLAFDEIALFESRPGNGAPRYTPLQTFPLG